MLLAVCLFSISHSLIKFLDHLPLMELIFFRSFITCAFCFVLHLIYAENTFGKNKKALVARAFWGVAAFSLYSYSVVQLPLSLAVMIQHTMPLFAILLSARINKEGGQLKHFVGLGVALLSILFIKEVSPELSVGGLLVGIGAAFCAAMAMNYVRVLGKSDSVYTTVLSFTGLATFMSLPFCLLSGFQFTLYELKWLALMGGSALIAQICLTYALKYKSLPSLSIIKYVGIINAVVIGIFVFDESFSFNQAIGFAILAAALFVYYLPSVASR